MKRYKLLKDLPTYEAGETFYIDELGRLCAEDTQGQRELVAYMKSTLEKFPNILAEWFEEIVEGTTGFTHRPKIGSEYWAINENYAVEIYFDRRDDFDNDSWEIGNYFATEKDAERALAKMKAYTTVKRDAKGFVPKADEGKWFISCFTSHNKKTGLVINYDILEKTCGVVYFASEGDADYSIKNHRKEWELLFDLDLEETK